METKNDWVHDFIYAHRPEGLSPLEVFRLPRIICGDHFSISMQIGDGLYSDPRVANAEKYEAVELGYPSAIDPLLTPYAEDPTDETDTVYPYIPVAIVNELMEKHSGIVASAIPFKKNPKRESQRLRSIAFDIFKKGKENKMENQEIKALNAELKEIEQLKEMATPLYDGVNLCSECLQKACIWKDPDGKEAYEVTCSYCEQTTGWVDGPKENAIAKWNAGETHQSEASDIAK